MKHAARALAFAALPVALALPSCVGPRPPSALYDVRQTSLEDVAVVFGQYPTGIEQLRCLEDPEAEPIERPKNLMFGNASTSIHVEAGRYALDVRMGKSPFVDEARGRIAEARFDTGRVYMVVCESRIVSAPDFVEEVLNGEVRAHETPEGDLVLAPHIFIRSVKAPRDGPPTQERFNRELLESLGVEVPPTWVVYEFVMRDIGSVEEVANDRALWDIWKVKLQGSYLLPYHEDMWDPYYR